VIKTFGDTAYTVDLGSDVNPRDGMFLELRDAQDAMVAEVYFDDPTGDFTVTTRPTGVPLEIIEWLLAEARTRLPPRSSPFEQ
jgi:hypothetical protein